MGKASKVWSVPFFAALVLLWVWFFKLLETMPTRFVAIGVFIGVIMVSFFLVVAGCAILIKFD